MNYWKYTAFNERFEETKGIMFCESFTKLALNLRQKGLQVITARKISKSEYLIECRINKMKSNIHNPTKRKRKRKCKLSIIKRILSLFKLY